MLELLALFAAAFFDTLTVSGYFFYGTGVLLTTTVALIAGISPMTILIVIVVGACLGDTVNYYAGYRLGKHPRVVSAIAKAHRYKIVDMVSYRAHDSLLRRIVLASILRFVAASRPVNAILLGTHSRRIWSDVLALYCAAAIWSSAWLYVVLFFRDLIVT